MINVVAIIYSKWENYMWDRIKYCISCISPSIVDTQGSLWFTCLYLLLDSEAFKIQGTVLLVFLSLWGLVHSRYSINVHEWTNHYLLLKKDTHGSSKCTRNWCKNVSDKSIKHRRLYVFRQDPQRQLQHLCPHLSPLVLLGCLWTLCPAHQSCRSIDKDCLCTALKPGCPCSLGSSQESSRNRSTVRKRQQTRWDWLCKRVKVGPWFQTKGIRAPRMDP